MARKVKIQGNMAAMLSYLGQLYQSPADALKEYISNALDAWREGRELGLDLGACEVAFRITPARIVIEHNAPGMDEKEFEDRLKRVADSIKKETNIAQIGQLGIGIWGFMQVGRKCTFFSKKAPALPTLRVTLREGRDDADFEKANQKESLAEPGMRIVISELKARPTKARGPLAVGRLEKKWGELYDSYLRNNELNLTIEAHGVTKTVAPPDIGLPRLAEACSDWHFPKDPEKAFRTCFYYDGSGKGAVSVRHAGVDVIDDLGQRVRDESYWDETVYSSGFVRGFIEADFLKPLPSRTGFEANDDWLALLIELETIGKVLQEEVETIRAEEDQQRRQEIHREAIELARDILDDDEFMDLELLGGLARRRRKADRHQSRPAGERTGERSKTPGETQAPSGSRINVTEDDFEDGARRHSEFIDGVVRINRLHPDYRLVMKGSDADRLAYCVMLIGKETIGFNDQSGLSDDALERLVSYMYGLQRNRVFSPAGKGFKGRSRAAAV